MCKQILSGTVMAPTLGGVAQPAAAQVTPREEMELPASEATGGQPESELSYGLALLHGRNGIKPYPVQGYYGVRRAARHGNLRAMRTLAHVYNRGELGVAPDSKLGTYWQQRAQQGQQR